MSWSAPPRETSCLRAMTPPWRFSTSCTAGVIAEASLRVHWRVHEQLERCGQPRVVHPLRVVHAITHAVGNPENENSFYLA